METRKNFDVDPNEMPFYLFEHGGTSCMRMTGEDNGEPFNDRLIAFHVNGRLVVKGDEVEGESQAIVGLHLDSAEKLLRNLTDTIRDFKNGVGF